MAAATPPAAIRPALRPGISKEVAISLGEEATQATTPTTTPELRRAQELERAKREKPEDPEGLLLRLTAERKGITFNVEEEVKKRIDIDDPRNSPKDAAGNLIPTHPYNRTEGQAKLVKRIGEGQFTLLAQSQKDAIVARLVAGVLDRRGVFSEFPPAEAAALQASIIRRLLASEEYQGRVVNLLTQRLGPEAANQDIATARSELLKAMQDFGQAELAGDSLDEATAALNEFAQEIIDAAGNSVPGEKYQQMEDLRATGLLASQAWTQAERKKWETRYPPTDAKEQKALAIIENEVRRKMAAGEKITNADELVIQKLLVSEDYWVLRAEQRQLLVRYRELSGFAENVNNKVAALREQEEKFAQSIEGILVEAGNQTIEEEFRNRFELQSQRDEEAMKKADDQDEEAIWQGALRRWERRRVRGGRRVPEPVKERIHRDFGMVMTSKNGPDQLIAILLLDQLDRKYTRGTPEYIREEERLERRVTDKDFMNKMRQKLVPALFNRYIYTGGKMYRDDVRVLKDTDWGSEAIAKAIEANEKLRQELDDVYGSGVLTGEGFRRWLRRKSDGSVLKLLLIMLTVGGLGTMALKDALKDHGLP